VTVVDTNVIAYLWIPGVATERAERLYRADPEWCAPLLWRSELRNLLAAYLRRRRLALDDAIRIAEAALAREPSKSLVTNDRQILRDFSDVAVPL
jgi:predicted nucleic acid-binding protein